MTNYFGTENLKMAKMGVMKNLHFKKMLSHNKPIWSIFKENLKAGNISKLKKKFLTVSKICKPMNTAPRGEWFIIQQKQ